MYQLPMEDSNKAEEVNLPSTNLDLLEILKVIQKHLTKFLQLTQIVWPLPVSFGIPYIGDLKGLNHIQSRKHFIGRTFFDLLLSHTSYYVHQYASYFIPLLYDKKGSLMENRHYLPNNGIIMNKEQFLR